MTGSAACKPLGTAPTRRRPLRLCHWVGLARRLGRRGPLQVSLGQPAAHAMMLMAGLQGSLSTSALPRYPCSLSTAPSLYINTINPELPTSLTTANRRPSSTGRGINSSSSNSSTTPPLIAQHPTSRWSRTRACPTTSPPKRPQLGHGSPRSRYVFLLARRPALALPMSLSRAARDSSCHPNLCAAPGKLARLTTPDPHQGPLLGDKTTITAITEQYAKADPIYVDKTMVSIPPPPPRQTHQPTLTITSGPPPDVLTLQTRQRRRQLWVER